MTIKDGKKTGKDVWRNKKNKYKIYIVYYSEIELGCTYHDCGMKGGWVVSCDVSPKSAIESSFKTKSQALKFAKSYMRKH